MPSVQVIPQRQQQPNELQQFGKVLSQLGLDRGSQELKRTQMGLMEKELEQQGEHFNLQLLLDREKMEAGLKKTELLQKQLEQKATQFGVSEAVKMIGSASLLVESNPGMAMAIFDQAAEIGRFNNFSEEIKAGWLKGDPAAYAYIEAIGALAKDLDTGQNFTENGNPQGGAHYVVKHNIPKKYHKDFFTQFNTQISSYVQKKQHNEKIMRTKERGDVKKEIDSVKLEVEGLNNRMMNAAKLSIDSEFNEKNHKPGYVRIDTSDLVISITSLYRLGGEGIGGMLMALATTKPGKDVDFSGVVGASKKNTGEIWVPKDLADDFRSSYASYENLLSQERVNNQLKTQDINDEYMQIPGFSNLSPKEQETMKLFPAEKARDLMRRAGRL